MATSLIFMLPFDFSSENSIVNSAITHDWDKFGNYSCRGALVTSSAIKGLLLNRIYTYYTNILVNVYLYVYFVFFLNYEK